MVISIKQKLYICKECEMCGHLFWTKKRSERPLAKTCGLICLSTFYRPVKKILAGGQVWE